MNIRICLGLILMLTFFGMVNAQTVVVGDATISEIGGTAKINITLTEAPNGLSGYNITLSLSNPSVAEIIAVEFPSWALLTDNSTLPADTVWIKAVDLEEQVESGATDVLLATLTIRCDGYGNSILSASVEQMDDDNGDPITPSIDNGSITQPAYKVPIMNIVGAAVSVLIIAIIGVMLLRNYRRV